MALDSKIWGPHYWFVLHTIALNYPLYPNQTIKKKYYDFIHNLPLFIPNSNMANFFSKILDDFPITPYLDSRESFIKWMYFIHNKINLSLEKQEVTLSESLKNYYNHYRIPSVILKEKVMRREKYVYLIILAVLILLSIIIYNKYD